MYNYFNGFEPSIVSNTPKAMVSVNVVCAETESEDRSLFKSYELFLAAGKKLGALPLLETALKFPLPRYSPQINLNIVGDPN